MTPERIYKAYNFIKEHRNGEIALRLLAVPALIAMVNVLDEKINVQQEVLKAWKQTTEVAQIREKSGVIFEASSIEVEEKIGHEEDRIPAGLTAQEVGEPLINDAFWPPDLPPEGMEITTQDVDTSSTLNYYQTSEFMIGKVAVSIIFPESDGSIDPSTEDWTNEEQAQVLSEIVAAMDWWAAREPRANLVYFYDIKILPTGYEPINRPRDDQGLWIRQMMEELDYSASSYFARVRDYNNALRDRYQTDWAFTIFVVDSSNDADNQFLDGGFASAYIGGPLMVMTLGNNGYGLNNMDAVAAHEVGHIFHAFDQHFLAHVPCTARSGYLQVENQNSQYGNCSSNESSIMRGHVLLPSYRNGALDKYARGQVGWWDLDRDNILDPVDPEVKGTFLYSYYPDLTTNNSTLHRGLAIATNGVASIEYRVETTGIWQPTDPIDGVFNGVAEPFQFTALEISRKQLVFQIRLTDSKDTTQVDSYDSSELIVRQPAIWLPLIVR